VPESPPAPPVDSDDDLFQSLNTADDRPFVAPAQTTADSTSNQVAPPVEPAAGATTEVEVVPPQPTPKVRRPRNLRKLLKIGFVVLVAGLFGGATMLLLQRQADHNSPQQVFNSALQSALSTTQLKTDTGDSVNHATVSLDFTVPTKIVSSSQSTVNINGGVAQISGYGSVDSTYISYQKLPSSTSATTAAVAKDAWVQLRQKSVLPPGVSAVLTNAADPRFQAFGPIVFGNFPDKTQSQLLTFISSHDVYHFDPKQVKKLTREGKTVLVYPVKLNSGSLSILNESAASSEGLKPGDVQAAMSFISSLKDTTVTIYVDAGSRQFTGVDIEQGGQTTSFRYSSYDHVSLADEPQTKLSWAQFAATQLQIETQAAAKLTPTQVDALRQGRLALLHNTLHVYFADNSAYPTATQLNDQTWVQNNLAGLDPDALHDPLAATTGLATTPKATSFAYQPTGADGKVACDNLAQNCDHYMLSAVLSTGKVYTVKDL